MGIPSYFSYIVKNHLTIINKFNNCNNFIVNNFYMDCNSIIYDVVNMLDYSNINKDDDLTNHIINQVIYNIEKLINIVKPNNNIFIAFDGVAPLAKIEQQRCRRFKSIYQSKITKSIIKNKPETWNTTAITPGTLFMKLLNERVHNYFNNPNLFNAKNIIYSGSNYVGEGEHKIFEYMRINSSEHKLQNTIIYGLDSDLIMLSINHLSICPNIFLLREAPQFIKSINIELEPNEFYLLDINQLTQIIINSMNNEEIFIMNEELRINKIHDYIFLCFFLGNDFMPHFPSINIRTGGIDKLIYAYKYIFGNSPNQSLINDKNINWKNLRKLIQYFAENEEKFIQQEHKLRDRKEKIKMPDITPEDKLQQFNNIPCYERSVEKYINPFRENWRHRYYKSLFDINNNKIDIKKICINFLEGLEWNFKYYSDGCPHWRWCYDYNYPPLFSDLLQFIPTNNDWHFFTSLHNNNNNKNNNPISDLVQLCYVLPRHSLYLLPDKLHQALIKNKIELYKNDCDFDWAYCKYFWECHANLPKINIDELEKFVIENV